MTSRAGGWICRRAWSSDCSSSCEPPAQPFASDIALPLWLGSRPQIWPCGTPGRSANPSTVTDCRRVVRRYPGEATGRSAAAPTLMLKYRAGGRADFVQVGLMTTTCKMCGPRDIAVLSATTIREHRRASMRLNGLYGYSRRSGRLSLLFCPFFE
jgi:hypothetical protein